jgi:hypothetical protein
MKDIDLSLSFLSGGKCKSSGLVEGVHRRGFFCKARNEPNVLGVVSDNQ